jgi:protocatechuate 3,4-dioxygenase beta subunit
MQEHDALRDLTAEVQARLSSTSNIRLGELIRALVRHLHQLAAEVHLTHQEFQQSIEFLTAVGQMCTPDRQEFMLLSDVLGLSSAVDVINDPHPAVTPGTVLGPYYVADSPARAFGASLIDSDDGGQRLRVRGVVRSVDGTPISGATIDVWSCASNGLYPAQDRSQARTNLRGLLTTNAQGCYEFVVLRPLNYSIPMDGPVGHLMRATGRSPMRAAHIHAIITAKGYIGVTTHLFDQACPYLNSDAVFSTRDALVRTFTPGQDGELEVRFDVTLARLGSQAAAATQVSAVSVPPTQDSQ